MSWVNVPTESRWCMVLLVRYGVRSVGIAILQEVDHGATVSAEDKILGYSYGYLTLLTESGQSISHKIACAPSDGSDQLAHPRNLISLHRALCE